MCANTEKACLTLGYHFVTTRGDYNLLVTCHLPHDSRSVHTLDSCKALEILPLRFKDGIPRKRDFEKKDGIRSDHARAKGTKAYIHNYTNEIPGCGAIFLDYPFATANALPEFPAVLYICHADTNVVDGGDGSKLVLPCNT